MNVLLLVLGLAVALALGAAAGYFYCKSRASARQAEARNDAQSIIEDAQREAETTRREAELSAKEAALAVKDKAEVEVRARRAELSRLEERLDNRDAALDRRDAKLDEANRELARKEEVLNERAAELEAREADQVKALEEVSGLTRAEAERRLTESLEVELEDRLGRMVRDKTFEAEEKADAEARRITAATMERLASDITAESTVKAVALPSDDMKGRVIGREGRNIRAFEAATGVDVIIDDTPETVVISCFDPVRREIGRVAMERLVQDGRIHPGRIEQVVSKAKKEIEKEIKAAGRQALYDAKISGGMHGDLMRLLGALKYRTSYGQNVLSHSVEVANLCGMMAAELGANVKIARRGALLHDVGKAIDHEVEGTHALIGGRFAKKSGESDDVVRAISAHHHEIEMETVEDVLVATADAVSAARPGARRETTETYIERLRSLEDIALTHRGVDKAYAIQAGREIRVMVQPSEVDDRIAAKLAFDISKQIESDLEYPGQIKVTVIRESRGGAGAPAPGAPRGRGRRRRAGGAPPGGPPPGGPRPPRGSYREALEGPYRDLGAGFARLSGVEGLRRSPGRLRSVEDALFELLRNSRDAGAHHVYVATSLSARRYRQLTVIDDGCGIPETHKHLVFEAGVTTRHLNPISEAPAQYLYRAQDAPHGAGLSLYYVKNAALSAEVLSASSPTSMKVVFDTRSLPEKRLQSSARPSKSNLPATLSRFLAESGPNAPHLYHASPSGILSRLLKDRVIQIDQRIRGNDGEARRVWEVALGLGLEVSLRTVHRVLAGSISAAGEVTTSTIYNGGGGGAGGSAPSVRRDGAEGPILSLGDEDLERIRQVLAGAAGASYLELAELEAEARPGEVILRAHVYEREDEYE